jgi:periplasmic protein TonB
MRKKSLILSSWCKAFFAVVLSLFAMLATGQEARKALSKPAPSYPDVARRLNLAGVVKIEVVVGPDGEIKGTKVIGGHPVLIDAALKTLRDWKYERASSETKLELEFKFQP